MITAIFVIFTILIFTVGVISFVNTWENTNNTDLKFALLIITIVVLLINFGLIGGVGSHFQESTLVKDFEYSKMQNGVSVSFKDPYTNEGKIKTYTDVKTYNTISDSSAIKVIAYKNVYKVITHTETKVITNGRN